jgi:hypothetical protein
MRLRWLIVPVVCVLVVAGCGDDDDDRAAGRTTTTTTEAATTSSSTTTSTTAATFDGSTSPTSIPADGNGVLTDVRIGAEGGVERVVFEFRDDALPGASIQYVDPPIEQDGSGEPIEVDGEAFLEIVMMSATSFDFETGEPAYDGPDRVTGGTSLIREVVRTGDFEGYLTWVVGLDRKVDYRALKLDDGRFVIELDAS